MGLEPKTEYTELLAKIQAEQTSKRETKTFGQCATAYVTEHKAGWKNAKSEVAWTGSLKTHALPVIGSKDVASITTHYVLECVKPIWLAQNSTAKNVRSRIECVLDWATTKQYRTGDNRASWRNG